MAGLEFKGFFGFKYEDFLFYALNHKKISNSKNSGRTYGSNVLPNTWAYDLGVQVEYEKLIFLEFRNNQTIGKSYSFEKPMVYFKSHQIYVGVNLLEVFSKIK